MCCFFFRFKGRFTMLLSNGTYIDPYHLTVPNWRNHRPCHNQGMYVYYSTILTKCQKCSNEITVIFYSILCPVKVVYLLCITTDWWKPIYLLFICYHSSLQWNLFKSNHFLVLNWFGWCLVWTDCWLFEVRLIHVSLYDILVIYIRFRCLFCCKSCLLHYLWLSDVLIIVTRALNDQVNVCYYFETFF